MIINILASQILLATLSQGAIFFDPTAVKHSCVNEATGETLTPGLPVHLTDVDTTDAEQTILLQPITPRTNIDGVTNSPDKGAGITSMCVFHRWTLPMANKTEGKGYYFPLGRSMPYVPSEVPPNANFTAMDHTWERVDGDWSRPPGRAVKHGIEYVCGVAGNSGDNFVEGEYLCEVTLPTTSKLDEYDPIIVHENNVPYFLTYYQRNLTVRDEISRFLQKNTFGPTKEEIDELEAAFYMLKAGEDPWAEDVVVVPTVTEPNATVTNTTTRMLRLLQVANATDPTAPTDPTATDPGTTPGSDPVSPSEPEPVVDLEPTHADFMKQLQINWVLDQMDPTTFSSGEFSSLRKYWRRRLNPRKEETYKIGESGPHPCEKNSRWRKFAFTHFDVQNAQMLRWGNQDIGGAYQTRDKGHRITVETVEYWGPPEPEVSDSANITANSTGLVGNSTLDPLMAITGPPSNSPVVLTSSPSRSPVLIPLPTSTPTISLAPTIARGENLLVFGDMEGTEAQIRNQWISRCPTTFISGYPDLVASGTSSLRLNVNKKTCYMFRPIGPACKEGRMAQSINEGDTLLISLKVRVTEDNQIFQMYTSHYHVDKPRKWGIPKDDSYMISRTLIPQKDVWTTVTAVHKVGPDWTFKGEVLNPVKCNHYHLRFRVVECGKKCNLRMGSFYIDDVNVQKMGDPGILADSSTNATVAAAVEPINVPTSGFFLNPDFEYEHQFWKMGYASSGYFMKQPWSNKNVFVMSRGKVLRQSILPRVQPAKPYQFAFKVKLAEDVEQVHMRIIMRMRFLNNDPSKTGLCPRAACNIFERPLNKKVKNTGGWQEVVTEEFEMFGNYTEWDGEVDYIYFQMYTKDMAVGEEFAISGFYDLGDDYTDAPSTSMVPSSSPTSVFQEHIGYVIRYAGEIRTVIRYPFQNHNTGEIYKMDGSREFELCDIDEVEGMKADYENKMNFWIGKRCVPIRNGNPTVNPDPRFIDTTEWEKLHLLNLTSPNLTLTAINVNQTYEGDWLLETAVQDDVCTSLPTPYDNDYRGADPSNPDDVPTRFVPDQPVFGMLPDGSYAIYDSRLILHENTLENPVMDGGGHSVLRSTLRAQRDGLITLKYPWAEEYYIFNDHNIALCSNEQPNFINQDHCVVSYDENVCVKEDIDSTNIMVDVQMVLTFDDETLANFYTATLSGYNETGIDNSKYLYAVDNLRWDESVVNGNITVLPCVPENPVSRWKPRPDLNASDCTNTMTTRSNDAFVHALETSNDENPYLRDIYLWNDLDEDGCDEIDYDQYGMLVMTEEGCWENMHPDYMSIYDFTKYEAEHPVTTTNIAYIGNFTETGILIYPDDHPMSYFEELKEAYGKITAVARYSYASTSRVNQGARYGDKIILDQFADQMKFNTDPYILQALADDIAAMSLSNKVYTNRGGGTLVCGSPNEVAPDPKLDDYFDVIHRDLACIGCQDSYGDYDKQKVTVWAMNVLEGEDQLCQRMTWSLYELLNVGTASNQANTESNLYTYDIYARHCFGNYFDILKEMTYNPKMGEQFNFADNTATRVAWDTRGIRLFPDENYAREIMQLYTIGLHELNPDGTETRDEFGRVIQTYTNVDIMSNARLFTGFAFGPRRGNVEELFRSEKSRFDPLRIEVDRHDFFPKSSVDGNWIGDRYPVCVDLPEKHFLKVGAMYRFRGSTTLPKTHYNPPHWDADESIKRVVLDPSSPLYQKLCNPGEDGTCNYANTVTLDTNLACYDKECRIDDWAVIQVAPGNFYEYIKQPCVTMSFYPSPKKVITGFSMWVANVGRRHTHAMCADPRAAMAARSCCLAGSGRAEYNYDFEFHGERVLQATNFDQCTADNGTVCDPGGMRADNPLVNIRPIYNHPYPSQNTYFWTDSDCVQSATVREDGMIAIINKPATNPYFSDDTVPFVDLSNTVNYISVTWDRDPMTFVEIYPSLNNTCGNGACEITSDDACHCSVELNETHVFVTLPSREEALSLKIGAIDPATFSDSNVTYSLSEASDDVEAYVSSDSGIIGATSTIFKVIDEFGDAVYLKNMASSITLGGLYELRNPPSFMNLARIELRDAEYEIDAFLKHLVRYPSTAPFVSKKLIQYHGISNPSPGFVQRVTQAFKSGNFTAGGVSFGSGKYGDLKAVAAAIALDPESLTPVVDDDPISGNIREPVLKVIQFMRSLSFQRRQNIKFRHGLFEEMSFKMGQMVFDPPDQFSFFSSDYAPPGVCAEADLVSPESELMSMSSVIGLHNGFFSFVNYGLAFADGGFGPPLGKLPLVGDYSSSMGFLSYPYETASTTLVGEEILYDPSAVSVKIDELSTLMTAGRLSAENKQVLMNAHASFNEKNGIEAADRVLLKLLMATPEFQTSNTIRQTGNKRSITPPAPKSSKPYKAIVYINLAGGVDSFNILTPGASGGCSSLYNEYWEARGRGAGIGLTSSEIDDIWITGMDGCEKLGVSKHLSAYKDIYNENKGIFFANMGHLHKPVTRETWLQETRTDLFSHHSMKLESHVVDAFREGDGPGVLGRMLDILQGENHGHAVGATAIDARAPMIDGSPATGRLADVMSTDGVPRVFDRNFLRSQNQELRVFLEQLHSETDDNSGVFGNAWSQTFVDNWNKTDALVETLRRTKLATSFDIATGKNVGGIGSQLRMIAKLINIRNERGNGINRDVFYCEMGGYDGHFMVNTVLENKLPSLNEAVAVFWAEIKAQGLANNVVVVQGSEFGRTITPNSNLGSDHAWGGNYFMFGGDVKGGKIMGEYPTSFKESDPINIGRGRLIPTTPWDALFYALTQWMGITDQDEIDHVLPNSQNFGCKLFTDYDLFNTGQQVLNGCGGATITQPIIFQVPEVRILTGEEQKSSCKLAMKTASRQWNFDRTQARCYVHDMTVVDSEVVPGMYDVNGFAVINFDGTTSSDSSINQEEVSFMTKAASATASDFVVAGALPQSEAPSESPSMSPSTSFQPSNFPSQSAMPTSRPSESPSFLPSTSKAPSVTPSISTEPTNEPSAMPSMSIVPSIPPTESIAPSLSYFPTPAPTARKVFEVDLLSRDIGYVGYSGQSFEAESGLYQVQGSGKDMWGTYDSFHYMYIESSGDATVTALVEGFSGANGGQLDAWAKGGIMFRDTLSPYSAHYSFYKTNKMGLANQYRSSNGGITYHTGFQTDEECVWLRVTKIGNELTSYYKPCWSSYWTPYGYKMSMTRISSNGYYVGIGVTSRDNSKMGIFHVSNIQLTRTCSSASITQLQCDQASNCESGLVTGKCYTKGEVPSWEFQEPVSNIFDSGSSVTSFGCNDQTVANNAIDGTTNKYRCQKSTGPVGLVIRPSHWRLSRAEGLRIYASNDSSNYDPVGYFIEGRAHSNYPWNYITQGNFPWSTSSRNSVLGLDIDGSSYTSGDREYVYTEVSFSNDPGTLSEYMEYRITWTSNRYCSFTTPTPTPPSCPPIESYIQGKMFSTVSYNVAGHKYEGEPWSGGNFTQFADDGSVYDLGTFAGFDSTTNIASFSNGEYCGEINAARSSEVKFIEDCTTNGDVVTSVSEPSICKYEMVVTICPCSETPTSTPTTSMPECDDLSSYIQFGEVEVYGLLELKTPLPTLEHPGDYVDSVLATSQSIKVVGGYSTSYTYDRYSFAKNTHKGWIEMNEASDVPGYIVEPPHSRFSVVQGMRVYMANNNPDADPSKYIIKGGGKHSGAQVRNEYNGLCWRLNIYDNNSDYRIKMAQCDSTDPYQYFYLSELGEIRTTMKDGYCLYTPYYVSYHYMYMIPCYSDMYGEGHHSLIYQTVLYSSSTKQFTSVYKSGGFHCLQENNFGYDFLDAEPCTTSGNGGLAQQHTFLNGDFLGNTDSSVRTRYDANLCWKVTTSYVRMNPCSSLAVKAQRFYMNELGEIRSMIERGHCLDPFPSRPDLDPSVKKISLSTCNSINYGPNQPEFEYHQWIYHNSTETFESVRYPGQFLDYNYETNWLYLHSANGNSNQKFYFEDGGPFFHTSDDDSSDGDSDWELISEGDLPWTSEFDRNPTGVSIYSTNEGGDPNKYYSEVLFYNSTKPYYRYKILFPETRNPDSMQVQFAAIELPGLLTPINYILDLPTSDSGSMGTQVRSVLPTGSTLTSFGCLLGKGDPDFSIDTLVDTTTNKHMCPREAGTSSGVVAVPSHGKLSIAKALRVYSIDNCEGCDPTAYILEGRVDGSSSWVGISEGDLPWKSNELGTTPRNSVGMDISSTYGAGDPDLSFTEVSLGRNNAFYREYKVTFTEGRNPEQTRWSASQIELPGLVMASPATYYIGYNNGGCAAGTTGKGISKQVVEECAAACDEDPTCVSFKYSRNQNTACYLSTTCDVFTFNDNSIYSEWHMWYMKVTDDATASQNPVGDSYLWLLDNLGQGWVSRPSGLTSTNYYIGYNTGGCVGKNELGSSSKDIVGECAAACDAEVNCVSFEYLKKYHTEENNCLLSTTCDFDSTVQTTTDNFMWYQRTNVYTMHEQTEGNAYLWLIN